MHCTRKKNASELCERRQQRWTCPNAVIRYHSHVSLSGCCREKQKRHTIVLLQFTVKTETKRWYDFPSVNEAMMGIVRIYEEEIQRLNPHMKTCTYDIEELFEYIGGLGDISCLVLAPSTGTYEPHGVHY